MNALLVALPVAIVIPRPPYDDAEIESALLIVLRTTVGERNPASIEIPTGAELTELSTLTVF